MFSRQMIGIDIGSFNTKIAIGTWSGKNLRLAKGIMIPTPGDAVSDGYITNLKKIEEALGEVLQKNRLKKSEVIFSAESTEIILREIVLPRASAKELQAMVPFEVEKHFPIRVPDYALEYQIIDEFIADGGIKVRLLVAAMPRKMVENYWELAKSLNLRPFGLELQAGSITRLLLKTGSINGMPLNPSATSALVDIGHAKLRVSFIAQGRLSFSRTVAQRGTERDQALAAALDKPVEKARVLQKLSTLAPLAKPRDFQEERLGEVIQEKVDDWVQEIQLLFRYYLGASNDNRIDQILLYGGYSDIPGIAEYIQEAFNRPTLTIRDLDAVIWTSKNTDAPLHYYLNAAGSLIQE